MFFLQSFIFLLTTSLLASADVVRKDGDNCSCGFYDANTKELFTESIIVYFNETDTLPNDFEVEDYENLYEKTWNDIYRQGAKPENVQIVNDSLQLWVSPSTPHHLVDGGSIRTKRRDIHRGSFRTFIKSPMQNYSGSAISMKWKFNETEVTELSVMNTNKWEKAWVGTFVNNEHQDRAFGVNYTTALNETAANRNYTVLGGTQENGTYNPWEYTEYRIDWTEDFINFYMGGNLTRSVKHKENSAMPSVPSAMYFKHWSTGNRFSMKGPPKKPSPANIAWIRMFFNSSSMTDEAREDFDDRCPLTAACSMNDISLRGTTPYSELSTQRWKQGGQQDIVRMPALWISVVCISFSTLLIVHALIKRAPWRKHPKPSGHGHAPTPAPTSNEQNANGSNPFADPANPFAASEYHLSTTAGTPASTRPPSSHYSYKGDDDLTIERADRTPGSSLYGGSTTGGPSRANSFRFDSRGTTPRILSPSASQHFPATEEFQLRNLSNPNARSTTNFSRHPSETTLAVPPTPGLPNPNDKITMETVTESAMPAPRMRPQPPPARTRVDYLAGLVAMCSLLVTVMHFGLSYVPAIVMPGAPQHHRGEYWVQQIVAPFFLNQMWLGVFFTTSVRFLVMGYLKKGNLVEVAKAAVRRTPRLMIPVTSIALGEYFLVDIGATSYLKYIPSITWSTWPYVARFETIGHFISEILELIYLIPTGVPQITFNYCTGVLWTIAVQLQGTWIVLLGAIVVYEVKTPWKRMAYYAFAILNHWYAQSWGSYLWFGLLLTDLDITFKYKKWLYDRPQAYYPYITCCWFIVALGFSANVIPNFVDFNFSTVEHDIHPDPTTGEAMWNTERAGYPPYYTPRLNGLMFAVGMQMIVEVSGAVQWVLSRKFFLLLFPHIFTIYLIHGIVFWSWGSWLMIFLAARGVGYSVNVVVVGLSSYAVLFALLPIVTPIIEALGKDITALVWMSATEKSPPRRRTLFPFPDDIFAKREKGDLEAVPPVYSSGKSSGRSSPSEKGKMRDEVKEVSQYDYRDAPKV
ncbi:hypothetical protein EJ04DRAFT_514014 [Polyplosphaeria fusca]|uniref:GH16 domain-containing protein n=1 Tax=Polyplosphaeria fusca TaxID=682080 RepID=A0A9P4QWK3_9PLEO|nr:hypothetical protein EJ04DRAFT_514014 [Polyplosphaeria fusca]